MRGVIKSILIAVVLGFFTVASAQLQLQPKPRADKNWVQLEQRLKKENYRTALISLKRILVLEKKHSLTLPHESHFKDTIEQRLKKENYKAALKMVERAMVLPKVPGLTFSPEFYFKDTIKKLLMEKRYITLLNIMEKIIVLQKEHSLTLSHEFHFQYAQVAFSTGLFQTAVDAAKKYLTTVGEKGTFYKEALALLKKVEQAKKIVPIEPEMVVIPAGHFLRRDLHSARINSFELSKFEVTWDEYDLFTKATGRHERVSRADRNIDRHPVINVSWEDAVAYTIWLSEHTGKNYRLQSAEEWEYAARAGVLSYGDLCDHGASANRHWIDSQDVTEIPTAPVGSFESNEWGLHDMIFNVREWCSGDWFEKSRQACGGSWMEAQQFAMVIECLGYTLDLGRWHIDFRVARSF